MLLFVKKQVEIRNEFYLYTSHIRSRDFKIFFFFFCFFSGEQPKVVGASEKVGLFGEGRGASGKGWIYRAESGEVDEDIGVVDYDVD